MKKNQFGVMQGRLIRKFQGRYQAHPLGYWQEEFSIAAELGLDLIEFILDFNDVEKNPLLNSTGISEIKDVIQNTGVGVKTICADYFMEAPLHSKDKLIVNESQNILFTLLRNASSLDITDIVIPCVDQSTFLNQDDEETFLENIKPALELAARLSINLALETDLPPEKFCLLLDKINSERVTVNYDTGNSASLGFDIEEEMRMFGSRITDIHIKDRIFGGGSVVLGTGDVDFSAFFRMLLKIEYKGPIIMQAFRDEEGISIFKEQLNWFSPRLEN